MKKYLYPAPAQWRGITQRPALHFSDLEKTVQPILDEVRTGGDEALRRYTEKWDGVKPDKLEVSVEEMAEAMARVDESLQQAIRRAAANIRRFHAAQTRSGEPMETEAGVLCWRRPEPIEKVGLYIPGGTAPLFSTILMLGIPASLAGCREIILCSPPSANGKLHPAILFAAQLAGITRVFKVGGAQAIAAMTFGTESIPAVYKIFGPGNQYVTCAKQLVQRTGVAIDMPAGPSEVAVLADGAANPAYVAADLLSQAEHGSDSQVLLVTTSKDFLEAVEAEVDRQVERLPRKKLALDALAHSALVLVENETVAMELLNAYAPEHLILACEQADELARQVRNAGSVFLGAYTPEAAGDYASGTNHVLPTNGYAHAYSGVSTDSFLKMITFQKIAPEGLQRIGPAIRVLAEAEGLVAHARAVEIRMQDYRPQIKNLKKI